MDKNCYSCKLKDEITECEGGFVEYQCYKCGRFNDMGTECDFWQEDKGSPQVYTTGQMIDMLMQDTTLDASSYDGKIINTIRYNPSGHFEGVDGYYDFKMSSPKDKWVITKQEPKRTYKSVFLEQFPKAKLKNAGMCVVDIFGGAFETCNEYSCEDCWNSEYKDSEGAKEDKL